MPSGRDDRRLPAWLPPETARAVAAARAAPGCRGSPEEGRAAVRAAAAACLLSLPAPMLAEVADAVAPADHPAGHVLPGVAPADPAELARRLAALAGSGTNAPADGAAGRLAPAGAARIGGD